MKPKLTLNNFAAGKIENFWMVYGDRPHVAFGSSSSDDDPQMSECVNAGSGARLSVLVMHDDAQREYAGRQNVDIATAWTRW